MDKKTSTSVTSSDRLEGLVAEALSELKEITPEIEYLEECVEKLASLKERRHKLNSLIINLKSILPKEGITKEDVMMTSGNTKKRKDVLRQNNVNKISVDAVNGRKIFIPEVALSDAKNRLRTKNNINYEIYKAVVFNTGEATTDEIKYYLIKNNIKQPKTGKGFENVELSEISSRTNYLVRKNLLISPFPGVYSTVYGWEEAE